MRSDRVVRKPSAKAYYAFLPNVMNKTRIITWLKRIHAWTGLWGALAFLFLGFSGVLLNHRSVLKIDTGSAREVLSANFAVAPGLITTRDEFAAWGQAKFDTPIIARSREVKQKPVPPQTFLGQRVDPPTIWRERFYAPNAIVIMEYTRGAAVVSVNKSAQNIWGVLKNLHKGAGMGVAWVLLFDAMSGALIAMSLTGFLLWSRLHGPRLAAVGLLTGSLALGLFAAFPRFL